MENARQEEVAAGCREKFHQDISSASGQDSQTIPQQTLNDAEDCASGGEHLVISAKIVYTRKILLKHAVDI